MLNLDAIKPSLLGKEKSVVKSIVTIKLGLTHRYHLKYMTSIGGRGHFLLILLIHMIFGYASPSPYRVSGYSRNFNELDRFSG